MKKTVKSRAFKDRLKGHKDGVICLYSPEGLNGGILYSASRDRCIRIWDLINRKITVKLRVSRNIDQSSKEAENINDYLQNEQDENLQADFQVKEIREQPTSSCDEFTSCAFSLNSVYGGFQDGNIFCWNLSTGEQIQKYEGHIDKVTQLLFIYPSLLASCSLDNTIRLWDVMIGFNQNIFQLSQPLNLMKVGGNIIYVIGAKNTYFELDIKKQKIIKTIKFCSTSITNFITIDDKVYIATIDNTIEVYDLGVCNETEENQGLLNVQPIKSIDLIGGWVYCMTTIENYLLTAGDDRLISVWDLNKQMKLVEEFQGHENNINCLEFAGNMLFSGSFDHSIRSWDIQEMYNRIRERNIMFKEDLYSLKFGAWYMRLYGKKKKKKGAKKGKSKSKKKK